MDGQPRIYLHPNGRCISIGFEDTNDTLLAMPDQEVAWRDWERARDWVAAIERLLTERSV